jgi:hypothetical protein
VLQFHVLFVTLQSRTEVCDIILQPNVDTATHTQVQEDGPKRRFALVIKLSFSIIICCSFPCFSCGSTFARSTPLGGHIQNEV